MTCSEVRATLVSIQQSVFFFWLAGSSQKHSAAQWCLQNIAQESIDSSDEEFFDARGWCCCFVLFFSPLHPRPSIHTEIDLFFLISVRNDSSDSGLEKWSAFCLQKHLVRGNVEFEITSSEPRRQICVWRSCFLYCFTTVDSFHSFIYFFLSNKSSCFC